MVRPDKLDAQFWEAIVDGVIREDHLERALGERASCTSRVFPRHPVLGMTVGQLACGTSWAASELGGSSHCSEMRS